MFHSLLHSSTKHTVHSFTRNSIPLSDIQSISSTLKQKILLRHISIYIPSSPIPTLIIPKHMHCCFTFQIISLSICMYPIKTTRYNSDLVICYNLSQLCSSFSIYSFNNLLISSFHFNFWNVSK